MILMCVSILASAMPAYASDTDMGKDDIHTISVIGKSEKKAEPDFADLSYAVTTEAETASECQDQNDKDVTKTLDLLKGLGIEERSIQTEFSMNPKYTDSSILSSSEIDGYEAITTITVSDIPIDSIGDIIGGSVQAGVNTLSSISYYSSKYDEIYEDALAEAVAMAQRKAERIADAAGYELEGPPTVSENGYNDYARYSVQENSMASYDYADMEKSVSVAPGQITVDAEVMASYDVEYPLS